MDNHDHKFHLSHKPHLMEFVSLQPVGANITDDITTFTVCWLKSRVVEPRLMGKRPLDFNVPTGTLWESYIKGVDILSTESTVLYALP